MTIQVPFRRAQRIDAIEISEIVQISERAAALKAAGADIVSFGTGEPDLPTPGFVIDAAHAAAKAGQTRYPPTAGTADLRGAVAARYGVERSNVIVSTGAKQVLANAMLATLDPGDEVIMPAPYWTSYSDIVGMSGGTAIVLPCAMEDGFKLTPDALERAISPRTRWLMLNSPSNPSGAVYSADELEALAAVLERHPHVWVLADEIYRHLTYAVFTSLADFPALAQRTLIVDGVSKAWSMTGWRIGWGVGPKPLIAAMTAVQGQITSGACSVAQAAALAALSDTSGLLDERRALFEKRRDHVVSALNAIPGLECPSPDGAFYVFPSCRALLKSEGGPFESDAQLCSWLLEKAGVAVVPGRAFGLPGHFRLSFAYSDADLEKGLSRIAEALQTIAPR